jgi:hypothetical protein
MLATILPAERNRLAELASRFSDAEVRAATRAGVVVHGDVHEAQLVVHGDEITGLLDVDDVGPGDPLDDMGTVLGHLRSRACTAEISIAAGGSEPARLPDAINAYADDLRTGFAEDTDAAELDVVTAAVMIGLATGPFRVQQPDWEDKVAAQLAVAEELLDGAMREVSAAAHRVPTPEDDRHSRHQINPSDKESSG